MTRNFLVGIEMIDFEHKEILALIERLQQQIESNDPQGVCWVLRRLHHSVKSHNHTEKHMTQCLGTARCDAHLKSHEDMEKIIETAIKEKVSPRDLADLNFPKFLENTLKRHIEQFDKPLFYSALEDKKNQQALAM
jgi:hemerythrin-like metal-binding protein